MSEPSRWIVDDRGWSRSEHVDRCRALLRALAPSARTFQLDIPVPEDGYEGEAEEPAALRLRRYDKKLEPADAGCASTGWVEAVAEDFDAFVLLAPFAHDGDMHEDDGLLVALSDEGSVYLESPPQHLQTVPAVLPSRRLIPHEAQRLPAEDQPAQRFSSRERVDQPRRTTRRWLGLAALPRTGLRSSGPRPPAVRAPGPCSSASARPVGRPQAYCPAAVSWCP